jgi:hypothetical protein
MGLTARMALSCSGLLDELGYDEPGGTGWYYILQLVDYETPAPKFDRWFKNCFLQVKKITGKEIVNPDPTEW